MDRIRWSERAIPFRSLVDNPAMRKPTLVQMGSKAVIVGEKINGEFIMASPCKVSGDRFDVMEQEIVLSSKHTGVWRVISKATSRKEGHIHRLNPTDLERIYKQDVRNDRTTPRSYICLRDIEAFELTIRNNDPGIAKGQRIDRRAVQIEEDTEFQIFDAGEVEYTPTEGERTTQDYTLVPKHKPAAFLQLLLPGVVEHEKVIRNRVVRALSCRTKGNTRQRQFLIEINEQPCEIRPIASEGSTELRYLHSTQNLYDYMLTYGNDTVLYVKLLRGDPPIKAIEFDGYMVLKNTLNGDKIPICRVEDLEVTLVGPDFPVKVRLPTKSEHLWRSLPEIRAAEIQCMQLSLALLARHESEMYVTIGGEKNSANFLQSDSNQDHRPSSKEQRSNYSQEKRSSYSQEKPSNYSQEKPSNYSQEKPSNYSQEKPSNYSQEKPSNYSQEKPSNYSQEQRSNYSQETRPSSKEQRSNNQETRSYYSQGEVGYNQDQAIYKSRPESDARKKHIEECEKVFGTTSTKSKPAVDDDMYTYQSSERLSKNLKQTGQNLPRQSSSSYYESSAGTKEEPSLRISKRLTHGASDQVYRSAMSTRPTYEERVDQEDSTYQRSQRPAGRQNSVPYTSAIYKSDSKYELKTKGTNK